MDDISSKRALVYDHKNNVELALRLSREFGEVLYFHPWKCGSPTTNSKIIGDGFEEIKWVRDFYRVIDSVDLFVFPEIHDGDLQNYLAGQEKRVWGSREGDSYEYNRTKFKMALQKVGLPVCPFERCVGMTALREYLMENDDKWIKTDMRGDGETWHHLNYDLSRVKLAAMDYYYGPAIKEKIVFIVDDAIDTKVEVAYDGFMVTSRDGLPQFPIAAFEGYESKNQAHILAISDYYKLPASVLEVNEQFAPLLAQETYRSAWGTEIKETDDSFFFLDATCRQPSPPGFIVMEMVNNLGEFMYHGAEGDLIELDVSDKVGVQVNLYSDWAGANHLPVQIPKDIRRWVKLEEVFQDEDGLDWVITPTSEDPICGFRKNVGAVVATGETIEEAIATVKERCDEVKGLDTDATVESLVDCLQRIRKGEKEGVEFPVESPEPASVLEGE